MSATVHTTIAGFRSALDAARRSGATVGLVPTMGALHEGHASLVRRAAADNDLAAVTIFVNPTQFGAGEDFGRYPRDLAGDVARAEEAGVQHVFAPTVEQMYPDGPGGGLTVVHVARITDDLEGAVRPGHFDGVATVVTKLLNIAGPCRAYFGEKDWQQLRVVSRLVRDLDLPVEVVPCPTVREADGLAMSSRNAYLSAGERLAAAVLHRALVAACHAPDPVTVMKETLASEPLAELEYAELDEGRLLIAARIGSTRLIDNMEYQPRA